MPEATSSGLTVYVVELSVPTSEYELCLAALMDSGLLGIEENEAGNEVFLRVVFPHEEQARACAAALWHYQPRVLREEVRDWSRAWQEYWKPIPVGERLYVAPEWAKSPIPQGRIFVPMPPGVAFGTGHHASTRLCLQALELVVEPGSRVLDVGTGSGILAATCCLLEAEDVTACDVDPIAVQAAREYFMRWGFRVQLFQGSVDAVRSAYFDVVVMNITTTVIVKLLPEVHRVLKQAGVAVLSGITIEDEPKVQASVREYGFVTSERLQESEWVALLLRK